MRRILLVTVPLFLFGCIAEGAHAVEPPPNFPVAESAAPDEVGEETAAGEGPVVLTVSGAASDGASRLLVSGRLDNGSAPAVFRLRTELGCARDTKLVTTTRGRAFSVGLGGDELADAFACAINAESGETSLSAITVTPDATSSTTATDIRLDPSYFAVVAKDLDARSGHMVRFTVIADRHLDEAHVTIGGATYGATIAPVNETDEDTMAIFEVPARAWATAVIDGAAAHVDAKLESGDYRSIVVTPSARVETLAEGDDEGC